MMSTTRRTGLTRKGNHARKRRQRPVGRFPAVPGSSFTCSLPTGSPFTGSPFATGRLSPGPARMKWDYPNYHGISIVEDDSGLAVTIAAPQVSAKLSSVEPARQRDGGLR